MISSLIYKTRCINLTICHIHSYSYFLRKKHAFLLCIPLMKSFIFGQGRIQIVGLFGCLRGGGDIFFSLSFSTSFALSENVVMRCGENAPPPRWICPCFWQTRRSWYKTLIFNFLSNIRNNQQRRLWHVFSIKPVGSVKSSSVMTYVCRACPLHKKSEKYCIFIQRLFYLTILVQRSNWFTVH